VNEEELSKNGGADVIVSGATRVQRSDEHSKNRFFVKTTLCEVVGSEPLPFCFVRR